MKPCVNNRKPIAWLAANALDERPARELRAHLETCEGCRRYLAEISNVTEKLAAAETNSEIHASEIFHQKVAGKLRAAKPVTLGEILLNWRVAAPVCAALVVIGVTVATWRRSPADVAPTAQTTTQTAPALAADNDLEPTMANYQRAADESPDKLDDLLTRQGKRALPSAPIYTASTLALAK